MQLKSFLLPALFLYLSLFSFRHFLYNKNQENMVGILGKVVNPEIAQLLLSTNADQLQRGVHVKTAILFCDIRNFTRITEKFSAEEIIKLLNNYFSKMTAVAHKYSGVVDKFIGDAALIVFGLTSCSKHPANNAVQAAFEMLEKSKGITLPNGVPIESGIGIDFGEVIAGPIGSKERYDYTVIGDAVNVASRLEKFTKKLPWKIIISERAARHLDNDLKINFSNLGKHEIRGKSNQLLLFGAKVKMPALSTALDQLPRYSHATPSASDIQRRSQSFLTALRGYLS